MSSGDSYGAMENQLDAEQFGRPFRPTAIPPLGIGTRQTLPLPRAPAASQQNVAMNTETSKPFDTSAPAPTSNRRHRRERGPNWTPSEVLVLIHAKRELHLQELDTPDARDLMRNDRCKWRTIANAVNESGFAPCQRDGPTCKAKWNQLYPDYKKIADYFSQSGRNSADYWTLTPGERRAQSLPRHYSEEFFVALHEWCGSRPQMNPQHVRNNLRPHDSNLTSGHAGLNTRDENESDSDDENPLRAPELPISLSTDDSSYQRAQGRPNAAPTAGPSQPIRSQNRSSAFVGVPAGVTPHVISSSSIGNRAVEDRIGNTVVKRKALSGPAIIADATKTTGTYMASQMKEIADANLQLERTKMDVRRQMFGEQMLYHRERDRIAQENAASVTENARLTVIKQQEMVHCLTELTRVLERGLTERASVEAHRHADGPSSQRHHTLRSGGADLPADLGAQSAADEGAQHSNGAATIVPVDHASMHENGGFY